MYLSASLLIFTLIHLLLVPPPPAEARSGRRRKEGEVVVVEGGEVNIPCAITPPPTALISSQEPSRTGTVQLVLWYKEGDRSSIYSYDGRDPHNPKHWSNRRGVAPSSQLSFLLPPTPAPLDRPNLGFLKLSHALSTDEGVYTCRVDYHHARTTETRTQLTVVVAPSQPSLEVWEGGRWRTPTHETSATQVEIGAHLTLRCTVRGGHPSPDVTWWRGGEQLLGTVDEVEGAVRSVVKVVVKPTDAHTPLVCQAANTPLLQPLRTPLHLLVLLSPSWVRILGASKPMSAGLTYVVECRSKGARPPPVLTWSVGGQTQVHASSQTDSEGETVSRLQYTPLASHAGSLLTCTARPPDHTAHSTPTSWVKSDSVFLSIMYKPEVELNFQHLVSSRGDKKQRRPPPFSPSSSSSSYKHDGKEESHTSATREEEAFSTNMNADGGREINESEYKATENNTMRKEGEREEKGAKGEGVDEEDEEENTYSLSEGEGGVLQCHVKANPPASRISWHHDGVPLSPGSSDSGGVVMGNMSIVVQKATREDAGDYTCTAHNSEGSSRSNPVRLHVHHGPTCLESTPLVLGVPRHHPLNVTCQVSSFPPPSGFSWELHTYLARLKVPQDRINWKGTTSWFSYTPRATEDYGKLICWAHTRTGRRQEIPCVARLVPADRPDPPERCHVTRRTPSSLTISCVAAHDGGLPQTFHVWVFFEGRHINNASSATSEVTVRGLQPDTNYNLTLWSANTYGTSTWVKLQASTTLSNITVSTSSSMNGHATEDTREEGPLSSLYPSLVAVVAVVTVVGIVVGVVAGMLSRHINLPTRHFADQDDDDDYHAAPPPSPGRRLKVHLRRSGRGSGALAKHIRRPSARYEFLGAAQQRESHVYDDPVPLRREKKDKVYEELRATPETECSTLSATPSDPAETLASHQSFSWHLPYCRLLRNNDFKDNPRKPVRVDPPKLPEIGVCGTEPPPAASPPPTRSVPRMDFRLILVPKTNKILQFVVEQDMRLKPYFPKDVAWPPTSGKSKFPAITEEEEFKPSAAKTKDACRTSGKLQTLTENNERPFTEEKLSRDQDGGAPVSSITTENVNARHHSRQEATLRPPGAIVGLNTLNNVKNTSWDHKLTAAQEKNISVDQSIALLTPRRPKPNVVEVLDENTQIPVTSRPKPSLYDAKTTSDNNHDAFLQEDGNQRKATTQKTELSCKDEDITREMNNTASLLPLSPVHDGEKKRKHDSAQGNKTPHSHLLDKLHSNSSTTSGQHQHHSYSTTLASIKRSYRSPISAQLATILDPMRPHRVTGLRSPSPPPGQCTTLTMKALLFLFAHLAIVLGQSCPQEGIQYFPDPEQCDKYYECRDGVGSEKLCPDGLLFNDKITDGRYPCFYRPEVDCGSRSRTQPPQPTELCPNQWGYFGSGDRAQCGYFYNCVNGIAFRVDCPAGLAFSSATYRCEWPDESPDCDADAFLGFSCPNKVSGLQFLQGYSQHRSPRNCREFFICVNGSPRVQYCQLGLVFDEVTRSCVEPDLIQGCENFYTAEELALYREQRERARLAEERRQAELQALRDQLAQRRQPQNF